MSFMPFWICLLYPTACLYAYGTQGYDFIFVSHASFLWALVFLQNMALGTFSGGTPSMHKVMCSIPRNVREVHPLSLEAFGDLPTISSL